MTSPDLALKSAAGRGVLTATILGSGMAMLDSTVVNIALPRIGTDLHAGLTALQWTVNAYALSLAGLLLLGGSLGDRLGRRRIYVIGVVWFLVASIGCAVAPNPAVLIAMRLLQGVGAALLTPGSLAILEAVFRKEDRAAAVGAWSGSAANAVTFFMYGALGGALFLLPVQLQQVAGYSPLAAGSALLPLTVVMLLLSARAGRLATKIGPRVPMTVGPIIAGVGLALYTRIGANASYVADVLPAVLVFALGLAATVAPLTATALAAAPAAQVGVASAVNNDIARIASLLAVAVLPGLAGITPTAYSDASRLSTGFDHGMLICAGLCVVAGLVSLALITGSRNEGSARHHHHVLMLSR